MTPTVDNLKFLVHTVRPNELTALWDDAVVFLNAGQVDLNWALYHWFKEMNKRYFYSYGTWLESDHDGGGAPIVIPTDLGDFLLLENDFFVLLESGDKVILE